VSPASEQRRSFPFAFEGRTRPAEETLRLVLEVAPGERPLLPEFGCRVHLLPAIGSLRARQVAAALIEEAVERWAPSLEIERAEVRDADSEKLEVSVRLRGRPSPCELTLFLRSAAMPGRST
jgi:phage baseplate assembly protein W